MATRRATSLRTPGLSRQISAPVPGSAASMFIGQWLRSWPKPLCISAQMLRARARAAIERGHRPCSGKRSARYSAMASVSQTSKSPSCSSGTLPVGLRVSMRRRKAEPGSKESKRTITSSNAMPACLSSTQGRIDQEE